MPDKNVLLIPLVAVVLVVLLPVILPVVAVLDALDRRRRRTAAAGFACVVCGRVLGDEALACADRVWGEHTAAAARAHPGARLRMVRTVHAVCPRCGTRYTFLNAERTFVPEDQSAHAGTDPPDA